MAEGCTFVASPFKPSHCKLCFQAKVDHKIPVLKPVTTKPVDPLHKPVETKPVVTSTPKSVGVDKPVNTSTTTHNIPSDTPISSNVETTKHNKEELLKKFNQEKPAETKPAEPKPVKTYKYQTNPQPVYTPPPTENKPKFTPPTQSSDAAPNDEAPVEQAPKKVFKPVGGVRMQGFDPSILVKAATERRAKKNLDTGELEEAQGAGVVEPEPEAVWEPAPLADSGNYKRGPGVDVLGGGLAALLQKRKQKEDAAEALANPNAQASEVVVEEISQEVTLPSTPTMNKIFAKIEEAPVVVEEATPEPQPQVTENTQQNTEDDGEQDWS